MRAQYYQVVKNGMVVSCHADNHREAIRVAKLTGHGAIVVAVREPTDCTIHKTTHLPPADVPIMALASPYGINEEDSLP